MSETGNPVAPARRGSTDETRPVRGGGISAWADALLAAVAFAALCVVVLSVAPQVAEPDDGAYHHSIVAIAMGDLGTLSREQVDAVNAAIGGRPGVPNQWIEVSAGRYISEKNPGYPFLAAPFLALGIIRFAPLFFGVLATVGLFAGAGRWLGRFGGAAAVGLYCSSGAAIAFAWRDYMPTFTDASLIAAGSGAMLWAVLATEANSTRRTVVGLAGFVALELAAFVRYTDLVILGVAVVGVAIAWRTGAASLSWATVRAWLASLLVFGAGVGTFDTLVYGGPLKTGYRPGEIGFSVGAIVPNLQILPGHLVEAMPMFLLGLVAFTWIIARRIVAHHAPGENEAVTRRDLWVGIVLATAWFAIWGVYAAYDWTTDPTTVTVQFVRFYLPAIGPISLLGAWLVTRVRPRSWLVGVTVGATIAVLFGLGVSSFYAMYDAFGVPLGG
jgi:hypothetical protein